MPASRATQRAFVLILLGCAVAPLHGASAEIASCPAGPAGVACRQPAGGLSLLQKGSTVGKLHQEAETGGCACAEAETGDDPCECPCELGFCTAVADPHFMSFDGFNEDYRRSMFTKETAYRLVKTDTMEIQGLAEGKGGWVSGFAVGGDFLKGHSLVMIMHGKQGINKMSHATVLLDGKPILSEENSQEHIPGVLDAKRHVQTKEEISAAVMKDLPEFQQKKNQGASYMKLTNMQGDHYHFKLPEKVEIFTAKRYILIKMPKRSNMRGWCGNFNGDETDDFAGRKKPTLAGQDLFDAQGSSSLFKDAKELLQLGAAEDGEDLTGSLGEEEEEQADEGLDKKPCGSSAEKLEEARKACGVISQPDKREECVEDVCRTGDTKVWKVYLDAEVEEVENARGIPKFMGHGRCLDSEKQLYTTLAAEGVGTAEGCRGALRELAQVEGVRGAQFGGEACQILVDGEHGNIETYKKVSDGPGELIIESTDGTEGYTCWKLN